MVNKALSALCPASGGYPGVAIAFASVVRKPKSRCSPSTEALRIPLGFS